MAALVVPAVAAVVVLLRERGAGLDFAVPVGPLSGLPPAAAAAFAVAPVLSAARSSAPVLAAWLARDLVTVSGVPTGVAVAVLLSAGACLVLAVPVGPALGWPSVVGLTFLTEAPALSAVRSSPKLVAARLEPKGPSERVRLVLMVEMERVTLCCLGCAREWISVCSERQRGASCSEMNR